jgi:hypothetical protein
VFIADATNVSDRYSFV